MLVEVRELRQLVELTPAVLLLVGVADPDAKQDRFLMEAEGPNRPERGAGLGSVQRGADRDALTPKTSLKNCSNCSGVSLTGKTQARSSFAVSGRSTPRSAIS
jgi:hypothetical protein